MTEMYSFDLALLLWPDALSVANHLKDENAQRRLFAHVLPEIWLLIPIEAEVDL